MVTLIAFGVNLWVDLTPCPEPSVCLRRFLSVASISALGPPPLDRSIYVLDFRVPPKTRWSLVKNRAWDHVLEIFMELVWAVGPF